MHLKILLPYGIFSDITGVKEVVGESKQGSFGLLPNRLDCTAALVPGILTYTNKTGKEVDIAVDEGILVKTGLEVFVSVRNAIGGSDLGKLREAVENDIKNLDERERNVRAVLAKLESTFIRRFQKLSKR